MRKLTAMMVVMTFVFCATFAFADDNITIDNRNNNTNTNTANANARARAIAEQEQDQKQKQNQDAHSSAVVYGNLPEVGFVGFLNPGTPILGSEWKFYYSSLYSRLSVKKIQTMRYGFHFSDLWPSKWGGRVQFTPEGESLPANQDDVLVMQYWPELVSNPGDQILGTSIVVGEPDWSDGSFLGEAVAACKKETMTRRIAIAYSEYVDGVTVGASIGLSGSTAEASNGSGFVIASGAMVGKNKTRAERVRRVKVLCMNDGPLFLPPVPTPAPPVVVSPPPVLPSPLICNPSKIWTMIKRAERAIIACTTWCYENLVNRRDAAEANIDMYACTHNVKFLKDTYYEGSIRHEGALHHFEKAEQNYKLGGHSIQKHQVKADAIMSKVYLEWAICIKIIKGKNAVRKFIKDKNLDINPDNLPSDFVSVP